MSPKRQILRLMAAMILAIIAFAAPSAVGAHEGHGGGHAHHGSPSLAAPPKAVPATGASATAPVAALPATKPVLPAAMSPRFAGVPAAAGAMRPAPGEDRGCGPGCKARCGGTMACCATGILTDPFALSPSPVRALALTPRDDAGRAGLGPAAPPRPPRTLA